MRRRANIPVRLLVLLGVIVCAAVTAHAEGFVELDDGRFFMGRKMTRTADGVVIHYRNGPVLVAKERIKWSCVDDFDGIEPDSWSEKDKEQIDRDRVFYAGKWQERAKLRHELSKKHTKRTRNREKGIEERLRWSNHREYEDKYFVFDHTLDAHRLKVFVEYMHAFLDFVKRDMGVRPQRRTRRDRKPHVGIMHDLETYNQVLGTRDDGGGVFVGFYRTASPEQYYYDEPLRLEKVLRNMRRGLSAYALYLGDPKFEHPQWIRAALSEYYGGMRWRPGQKPPFDTQQLALMSSVQADLRADKAQSIEDILEAGQRGLGKAQLPWVWSLVRFLMTHPKYAKGFRKFVRGLPRVKTTVGYDEKDEESIREVDGDAQKKALASAIGKSLKTIQEEWYQDINDHRESEAAEDLMMGAHLALIRDDWAGAEDYARQVIERDGATHARLAIRARALLGLRRPREAFDLYRQAIKLEPTVAEYYYWLAKSAFDIPDVDDPRQEKAWLLLARELEPWNEDLLNAVDELFAERGKRNSSRDAGDK